ncbi:hypothetical protein FRC17_006958 [Serendipita sp. 399]|nr:hypothetical protein FRC17_006958 [Serendipita sp. 399]
MEQSCQRKSAISKVPPEVWWHILYHALVPEFSMNEVYEGSDWIADARSMRRLPPSQRGIGLKWRILDLSPVCKLWKGIVDQIRRRFVPMGMTNGDTLTDEMGRMNEMVKRAWRVDAGRFVGLDSRFQVQLSDFAENDVQWRVLSMDDRDSKHILQLKFSQLRRLELYRNHSRFNLVPENLVGVLKCFKGALETLTWLEYCTSDWKRDINDAEKPITLPNLQVFHYTNYNNFSLPYDCLILPSLSHLHIYGYISPKKPLPLRQLIDTYGKTLQSLHLEIDSKDPSNITEDSYFPSWDKAPCLQEFGLAAPAVLRFPPLPSTHPLRIFAAQVWCVDDGLLSWLNSDNLKVIRLVNSKREADGSLVSLDRKNRLWDSNRMQMINPQEMEILEARAREKGVILQPCSDPDGRGR